MASMARAIRSKCLDCSGSTGEVVRCVVTDCPLWEFRFGKRPATVRAKQPKLLDALWVQLAGAIDDFHGDHFARQVLADPRSYYPELLASYSDTEIAAVVEAIKATPRSERFPGLSAGIDSGAPHAALGGPADGLDDDNDSEADEDEEREE